MSNRKSSPFASMNYHTDQIMTLDTNPLLAAAAHVAAAESQGVNPQDYVSNSLYMDGNGSNLVGGSSGNDLDSLIQIHRRKMLRRAANRRSAQLSRARKKAHMEDLKIENSRLQKVSDILDLLPELVFCMTKSGKVTYVSDRLVNTLKVVYRDDNDDDITHVAQFLSNQAIKDLHENIAQLYNQSYTQYNDTFGGPIISPIKEIRLQDSRGFHIIGYLRCSKFSRSDCDDNICDTPTKIDGSICDKGDNLKRNNKRARDNNYLDDYHSSDSSIKVESNKLTKQTSNNGDGVNDEYNNEEFICVIRLTDTGSGLSKASMVAHDLGHRNSGKEDRRNNSATTAGTSTGDFSKSDTSNGTNMSTTSETGSEDNGSSGSRGSRESGRESRDRST